MFNWDSRDFDRFKSVFGEPYAACTRNDMKSLLLSFPATVFNLDTVKFEEYNIDTVKIGRHIL